jgi:hypothetical protein
MQATRPIWRVLHDHPRRWPGRQHAAPAIATEGRALSCWATGTGCPLLPTGRGQPGRLGRFGNDQVTAYTRRMTRCMPMKACGMPVMSSATKHSSTYVPGGRS